MAACHDMVCDVCGTVFCDMPLYCEGSRHKVGCGVFQIYWNARPANARKLHPKETTVVYENPKTGKVVYPGRNDAEMPKRYANRGYVRKELTSLTEVDRFSKSHSVVNERAHYDKGSGRGYDDGK
jgi:hypothetical protein